MPKADNLPPSCAVVTKSGKLNFLEPFGPVQACNGTDLPLRKYGDNVQDIYQKLVRPSLLPLHLLTDVGDGQQRTAALLMETAVVGSAAKNESLKRRFKPLPPPQEPFILECRLRDA